jgi:tetratricopeptide (TPR) repeat protein
MRITPCPLLLHGLVVLVLLSVASVAGADAMPPGLRVALTKVSSLMEKKQYRTATETLESFRAKNTTVRHAELFFALGNGYLLQNRQAEAVQAYRQTVALDPHHTHGWLNLAKAHYDLKQYREAGRCFGKGYESEAGKHPHNLYYSAAALLMAGAHKEAVVTFERLFAGHARICTPQWKEQYIHALLGAGQTKRALPMIR